MADSISGHLILIMAPSGSGKGTLVRYVREELSDIVSFATSCTTRTPRPGEKDGETYFFKTREEFENLIEAGAFLEWEEYSGNLYGTLKDELLTPLGEGKLVLYELDVRGVQSLSEIISREDMTIIYLDAGGWDVLERRIRGRAPITDEELAKRKERYEHESQAKDMADVIIPNPDGKLEETKQKLAEVIKAEYNKIV